MPYTGLRDAILAHPTMAEGLRALFSDVPPTSNGWLGHSRVPMACTIRPARQTPRPPRSARPVL